MTEQEKSCATCQRFGEVIKCCPATGKACASYIKKETKNVQQK